MSPTWYSLVQLKLPKEGFEPRMVEYYSQYPTYFLRLPRSRDEPGIFEIFSITSSAKDHLATLERGPGFDPVPSKCFF